jgi:hypothetical protein
MTIDLLDILKYAGIAVVAVILLVVGRLVNKRQVDRYFAKAGATVLKMKPAVELQVGTRKSIYQVTYRSRGRDVYEGRLELGWFSVRMTRCRKIRMNEEDLAAAGDYLDGLADCARDDDGDRGIVDEL